MHAYIHAYMHTCYPYKMQTTHACGVVVAVGSVVWVVFGSVVRVVFGAEVVVHTHVSTHSLTHSLTHAHTHSRMRLEVGLWQAGI